MCTVDDRKREVSAQHLAVPGVAAFHVWQRAVQVRTDTQIHALSTLAFGSSSNCGDTFTVVMKGMVQSLSLYLMGLMTALHRVRAKLGNRVGHMPVLACRVGQMRWFVAAVSVTG